MNLRPEVVQKALNAVDNQKKEINENTSAVLKKLLSEAVKAEVVGDEEGEQSLEPSSNSGKVEGTPSSDGNEQGIEDTSKDLSTEETPKQGETDGSDWSEFESFKDADGKYNLTKASDEDIVRVFKKMGNTDKLRIVQDDEKEQPINTDTGAEDIIDLGEEVSNNPIHTENTNRGMSNKKLQTIYEVALGYTDSYQSKDAMTTPPNTEVAPNQHRELNNGIPTGSEKPWAKPNKKAAPFQQQTQEVTEEADNALLTDDNQKEVEEAAARTSVKATTMVKSDPKHPEGRPHRGPKATVETTNESKKITVTEAQLAKIQKVFEDNEKMKKSLVKFRNELEEAVVTNVATTLALRTIMENSTTDVEKKEIVSRFKNEAKTVDGAKALYETISRELKKTPADTIAESINQKIVAGASAQQINETKERALMEENEGLARIQSMMSRVCK